MERVERVKKAEEFLASVERLNKKYGIDVENKISILMYEYKYSLSGLEEETFKEDIRGLYKQSREIEFEIDEYVLLEESGDIKGVRDKVFNINLDTV